jgi:hypothetical protein
VVGCIDVECLHSMAFDAALPGFALQLWALIFLTIHLVSEYLSVAQASMTDSKSVHVCVCSLHVCSRSCMDWV